MPCKLIEPAYVHFSITQGSHLHKHACKGSSTARLGDYSCSYMGAATVIGATLRTQEILTKNKDVVISDMPCSTYHLMTLRWNSSYLLSNKKISRNLSMVKHSWLAKSHENCKVFPFK